MKQVYAIAELLKADKKKIWEDKYRTEGVMKMRASHRAQGADGMLSSLQYLPTVLDPAPTISIVESRTVL